MKGDIGVIGLAVMGQNLILNMNDNGFTVVAHNRTAAKVDEFLQGPAKGTNIIGAYSLEELVEKLEAEKIANVSITIFDKEAVLGPGLPYHLGSDDSMLINTSLSTVSIYNF